MVIVYYRTRPAQPIESFAALKIQRQRVTRWVESTGESVFAEFYEREGRGCRRPAYKAAIALGLARRISIVLAGHEPIGSGKPFREFNPNPRTYLTGLICLNSLSNQPIMITAAELQGAEKIAMIGSHKLRSARSTRSSGRE